MATSSTSAAPAADDPRRPDLAVPFVDRVVAAEDAPLDLYGLMSLIFGTMALLMNVKVHAWMCLLMLLAFFANINYYEYDFKQILAHVALVVIAFISTYFRWLIVPVKAAT
eukprot:CAMPEP_0184713884 /NCGR_PEP_ID=MMETSP0314-20130426/4157_1 /TAXON_ID=38298 /ORGANISM="Rhodella maculata, Strain CCMP 736" /LENGTH=110 /DNA_ID=CAMNT_0027176657 /DNA_START=25 /DNA_END=357 /DNA_ORIENTATION=-